MTNKADSPLYCSTITESKGQCIQQVMFEWVMCSTGNIFSTRSHEIMWIKIFQIKLAWMKTSFSIFHLFHLTLLYPFYLNIHICCFVCSIQLLHKIWNFHLLYTHIFCKSFANKWNWMFFNQLKLILGSPAVRQEYPLKGSPVICRMLTHSVTLRAQCRLASPPTSMILGGNWRICR